MGDLKRVGLADQSNKHRIKQRIYRLVQQQQKEKKIKQKFRKSQQKKEQQYHIKNKNKRRKEKILSIKNKVRKKSVANKAKRQASQQEFKERLNKYFWRQVIYFKNKSI
ncbi:hypothetical protein TTHERM_000760519 (macronuclear) [Tetrahymena thermophila SB210]|uniref:Uncharacterized protein n=1 Tax=Tetrahymena thermophila (strain SB210) TaxID=312017 RepID=W7XD47_TETTS|nr:hypothetical protein TTHERM_000760519 [Tetrahymena thermophila SB210]EWS71741.1 hypothetical protein TTHERM_000760519 [Tetrahymena thermophila SB210]|eukprot:XP_012655727.1 hypothetical protein TTHERM_000760519 [Tetrahymena thermophila SB210]